MPQFMTEQRHPFLGAQHLPQRETDVEDAAAPEPDPVVGGVEVGDEPDDPNGRHSQRGGDPVGEAVQTRSLGTAQRPLVPLDGVRTWQ
ncbi:hypothetical protein ACFQ08_42910 [Streptosporangium algeriense]|uniref:Uncharacterized protein n=1 Tax=Streptosporangium algeriense TaxID=1682748 RepID=A0ABW3E7D1_9ACTN